MSTGPAYKVRCPSCGKSFKVEGVDAGSQMVCRACGVRFQTAAPPLLGPLVGDDGLITLESSALTEPIAMAGTQGVDREPRQPGAVPTPGEDFGESEAHREDMVEGDDTAGPQAGANLPTVEVELIAVQPPAPVTGAPLVEEATSVDPDLPPWAAVASVPATPLPPANVALAVQYTSPPPAEPPRLVPTRTEPGDPTLEQQRLAMAPPWIPPLNIPAQPMPANLMPATSASVSATPASSVSPSDPLADTAVHAAIHDDIADHTPSDDDIRTILAAHRTGQVKLVDAHHRRAHPFWWTMLGMASAAVIVLIALIWTRQVDWFEPWEARAAQDVARLKADAEALAVRGSLREAHEQYQKIDELVAGRQIKDVQFAEQVEAARADGKRVYAMLLSRIADANRPIAAVTPPVATVVNPPAATTPAMTPSTARPAPAATRPATPPVAVTPPVQTPPAEPPPRPTVRAVTARVRPAPRPARRPDDAGLTDAEIGESIQRGVDYLLKQFDPRTNVVRSSERGGDAAYFAGLDALAVYALLQAGQAIEDPRVSHRGTEMKARLEALRNLPIEGAHQTYARGLRATALALFNRGEDFKVMANDVDWLLGTTDGGAYGYNGDYRALTARGNFPSRNGSWDNSNSQYGLLGVWSGIEADPRIEVPLAYWKAVDRHWTKHQLSDGQWAYTEGMTGNGRLTMTCAGIASLFVAHEYLEPPTTTGAVGREPFSPALKKALDWFERGDNSVRVRGGNWWGYTLYGIERVGLASGFKHFGTHDWYRELAEQIVRRQSDNGSWGDGVVDTSYAVLFLARGRHPILMNKLRFDGYWSNRPRDATNMARFASRQFERPINWQVVNVENPWTDWTDSPILYIASHEPPILTDEHLEKLRKFVRSGGMIFTHADAGSPAFDKWARELAGKLFPYELTEVPDNHAIWSSVYKLTARPALWGVSNGSRLLMVHSPSDITLKWQQRTDRAYESRPDASKPAIVSPDSETKTRMLSSFHFGMNLFVYAAGKRDLRNRLDSAWTERPGSPPIDTIRIARIQYGGNWDPEPGAWERYANHFHQTTGTRLDVQPIKLTDLKGDTAQTYPFAHLTGTARVGFTDADAAALRAYVEGGGVVLIDPTGGMNAFDTEVRESLLIKTFPDRFARLLDPGHPLMSAGEPGMEDVGKTIVRGYTLERLGGGIGTIQMLTPRDPDKAGGPQTGAIIVTSLDLTSGLLGINVWGNFGFSNKYSQAFVKNAIFWTVDGRAQR